LQLEVCSHAMLFHLCLLLQLQLQKQIAHIFKMLLCYESTFTTVEMLLLELPKITSMFLCQIAFN
jgi:hypothetical protein